MILVTQEPEYAAMADRIVYIEDGKILNSKKKESINKDEFTYARVCKKPHENQS